MRRERKKQARKTWMLVLSERERNEGTGYKCIIRGFPAPETNSERRSFTRSHSEVSVVMAICESPTEQYCWAQIEPYIHKVDDQKATGVCCKRCRRDNSIKGYMYLFTHLIFGGNHHLNL